MLVLSSEELSSYRRVSAICKSLLSKMFPLMFLIVFRILYLMCYILVQKQPSRGFLKKRCSKIMQQIYRRTLRHGFSAVNLLNIFRTTLLKKTSGRLLLLVLITFIGIMRTVTKEMSWRFDIIKKQSPRDVL